MDQPPSRRGLLGGVAAAALPVHLPARGRECGQDGTGDPATGRQLRALEHAHAARLGVFGYDTGTGRAVRYRSSAEPRRLTDTSSPFALGVTCARLVLGDALGKPERERLTGWLLANTTGARRLRAGLPRTWTVADKTGTGDYGTTNDVGIAWPPGRGPVVLAVLSTRHDRAAAADEPLVAGAAALVAAALA